jgi:hypothetical protein
MLDWGVKEEKLLVSLVGLDSIKLMRDSIIK